MTWHRCPTCQRNWQNQADADAATVRLYAEAELTRLPADPPHITAQRRRDLAKAIGLATPPPPPIDVPCPVCEDLTWLLDSGEHHHDQLAARLGISYDGLLRHVRRHHRQDLRDRLVNPQAA